MSDRVISPRPLPWALPEISLRRLRMSDLAEFQAYRTDPDVARYQGWKTESDATAAAFLAAMHEAPLFAPGRWIQVGIALHETDKLIGDIGACISDDSQNAEIGFSLNPAYQRRGLGARAVHELVRQIFDSTMVQAVRGRTDRRNLPSIRLLKRIGMSHSATTGFQDEDGAQTELVFSVTRGNFSEILASDCTARINPPTA
jgi:RimJ/RimL family protein N-acetyltransferase